MSRHKQVSSLNRRNVQVTAQGSIGVEQLVLTSGNIFWVQEEDHDTYLAERPPLVETFFLSCSQPVPERLLPLPIF